MDLVERYASSDPGPGPAFLPSFLSHCVPLLQPATDPALWRLVTSLVAHSAPGPGSLAPSRHSSCSASTNTRSATYLYSVTCLINADGIRARVKQFTASLSAVLRG